MKGAPIDKALCEYLKNTAAFYIKGTELWQAVNRLRCDGHPICSGATGYFYAARQSEIRATACAQIDFWNKYGRWVNRGTTGIALLVDTD